MVKPREYTKEELRAFGRLSQEEKDAEITKALDEMGRRMGEQFKREAEEKEREEREFQLWRKRNGLR